MFVDYIDFIRTCPINDDPEMFGLHANANISFAQSQTNACLSTLMKLQPKQVGTAGASQEDVSSGAARNILSQLPPPFDLANISEL